MVKKMIQMFLVCALWSTYVQANLQVLIPKNDFCDGNSLFLFSKDDKGCEQFVGSVVFHDDKTIFAHDDIVFNSVSLSLIENSHNIIDDVKQDIIDVNEDSVCLYFDVDPFLKNIRAVIIRGSLLDPNPYDVVEFSFQEEDEGEDFFDFGDEDDSLSSLNLNNIENLDNHHVSYYDTLVLSAYVVWAIQSQKMQSMYKNMKTWINEHFYE
jgi:hypothetical protein